LVVVVVVVCQSASKENNRYGLSANIHNGVFANSWVLAGSEFVEQSGLSI
jgi:hypothetical protein